MRPRFLQDRSATLGSDHARQLHPGSSAPTSKCHAWTASTAATSTSTTRRAPRCWPRCGTPSRRSCRCTAACTAARARSRASPPRPTSRRATTIARFVGARTGTAVIVRNTTEAINVLAHALPPGTRVLSTPGRAPREHAPVAPPRPARCCPSPPRRLSCWRRRSRRCRSAGPTCSPSPAPPTSRVRCGRSRSSPTLAHEHGAQLFVDAAQLAPHRAIDMDALGIDHLALSGPQALRAVRRGRAGQPRPRSPATR